MYIDMYFQYQCIHHCFGMDLMNMELLRSLFHYIQVDMCMYRYYRYQRMTLHSNMVCYYMALLRNLCPKILVDMHNYK